MASRELRLSDYEKSVNDKIKASITKKQNIRSTKNVIYTVTKNKIHLHKQTDKEILHEDGITMYPLGSNIPFIKHFDDKDIPKSITENDKLWW